MDLDDVMKVLASFEKERVEYILVGGVAVNFHGLIRATEDLDVFVRPTADNVARLRKALRSVYDDPSIDEISEVDLAGDDPAIRYYPPSGGISSSTSCPVWAKLPGTKTWRRRKSNPEA